jgi:hypothetical protein
VKVHWSDVLLATALAAAGCTFVYIGFLRALRRAVAERHMKFDQSLSALAAEMETLQQRVNTLGSTESKPSPNKADANSSGLAQTPGGEHGELKPETLAVITAAATTFAGKKVQVRAAQAIPAENAAGAWAQQGRVIVQTSHNQRPRS